MQNAMLNKPLRQRLVWIDLLKFIAIFMMIAVHCTDNVTPMERSLSWYNLWGSLYGSLMRPAIPLFVMITGVLLLPVHEQINLFYRKRVSRVVVPFLIWSILYNLFPWITGLLGLDPNIINEFFAWATPSQLLSDALGNISMIPFTFSFYAVQMWYVFLLIGIYLYLPIFSAWVNIASKKAMQIYLLIWGISLFIPYLRAFITPNLWGECSWNEFGMLYNFAGFNGYLLLGYYFVKYPFGWSTAKSVVISATSFTIGYLVTFLGFKTLSGIPGQSEAMVELFYTYCSPNVMLMTIPIFILAQRVKISSERIRAILKSVSICTFGIWMSHYLFLGPIDALLSSLPIHTMVRMIISSFSILLITWGFVAIVLRWEKWGKWIMG